MLAAECAFCVWGRSAVTKNKHQKVANRGCVSFTGAPRAYVRVCTRAYLVHLGVHVALAPLGNVAQFLELDPGEGVLVEVQFGSQLSCVRQARGGEQGREGGRCVGGKGEIEKEKKKEGRNEGVFIHYSRSLIKICRSALNINKNR